MQNLEFVVDDETVYSISRSEDSKVDFAKMTFDFINKCRKLNFLSRPAYISQPCMHFKDKTAANQALLLWNYHLKQLTKKNPC